MTTTIIPCKAMSSTTTNRNQTHMLLKNNLKKLGNCTIKLCKIQGEDERK